jgi:hypothetical protein
MLPLTFSLVLLFFLTAGDLLPQDGDETAVEDLSEALGPSAAEDLLDLEAHPVSLNRATVRDLLRIPWIDAALAVRIVTERGKRGGFGRFEELLEIPGISPELYESILPYLTREAEGGAAVRVDTKRSGGTGDARLSVSCSRAWMDLGLKARRGLEEGDTGLSGYLSLEAPFLGGLEVTAGDIVPLLGQGLLAWPSFGALRSPERPLVYPLPGNGLRPTTSTYAEKVVRGAGLSLSRQRFAAHLLIGRSGEASTRVPVGSLGVSRALGKTAKLEASVLSAGEQGYLAGLSLRMVQGDLEYFAECAGRSAGGASLLLGLARESGSPAFLFLYRFLSHRYSSLFGFDMALGDTEEGNLQAVYMGIRLGKGEGLALAFYGDMGSRLYRGEDYSPAGFEEFSLFLSVKRGSKALLEFSGKCGREEEPGKGETEETWRLRWDTRLTPLPRLSLHARWQVSGGAEDGRAWRTSLFFLQMEREDLMGFAVRARLTSAHCGEGGSVTLVEGGIPGRSEFVRLSGEEERYSLVVARKVGGGFTLRGKASWSLEREVSEVRGFGLEEWAVKTSFALQCEWKL